MHRLLTDIRFIVAGAILLTLLGIWQGGVHDKMAEVSTDVSAI